MLWNKSRELHDAFAGLFSQTALTKDKNEIYSTYSEESLESKYPHKDFAALKKST